MLLGLWFVSALQWLPISAQVFFSSPTAGEVIDGGVPFIVSVRDSTSAPYFSQMTDFSLLLLACNYSSLVTLYAWDLSDTSPSTVSNSITLPPSIGPSATSAYFLGIRGSILPNTSISVTYFSPLFTLQNMTGDTSLLSSIPAPTLAEPLLPMPGIPNASPERMITCDGTTADVDAQEGSELGTNGGVVDQACELEALSYFSTLATQVRTVTAVTAPVTTTPPVVSSFATLFAPASPSSTPGIQPSTTAGPGPQPTKASNSSDSGTASHGTSNTESAKMVYMLVIAGSVLATVIVLFWIWNKYGRRRYPHGGCEHLDCDCSRVKKMWDGISRPILYGKIQLDAEKGRLVTVWQNERGSVQKGGSTGMGMAGELSVCGRGGELDDDGRRMMSVRERGGAGDRRSRPTILAELQGDLGNADPMPEKIPTANSDRQMKPPELVQAPMAQQSVVVGKGEQGTVVRGKNAASIVAVGKKRLRSNSEATATIQLSKDLPHIPPEETCDCRENSRRTERQEQGVDRMRISEMREEIYTMRKEESSKQEMEKEIEGESCASSFQRSISRT